MQKNAEHSTVLIVQRLKRIVGKGHSLPPEVEKWVKTDTGGCQKVSDEGKELPVDVKHELG
ncbi:hypothetical protein JCM15519_23890 [Fundidesulfovibrio butyratiphilus]